MRKQTKLFVNRKGKKVRACDMPDKEVRGYLRYHIPQAVKDLRYTERDLFEGRQVDAYDEQQYYVREQFEFPWMALMRDERKALVREAIRRGWDIQHYERLLLPEDQRAAQISTN